jgi:N-methylhydantoinase A
MSTTVINAYVSPVLDKYLARLEKAIQPAAPESPHLALQIMQSNGGILSTAEARRFGVRCILSGPAGGIVGCQHIARMSKRPGFFQRVITFDMGGTSTDVSLINGTPALTNEATIGGFPIRLPVLDIHTIGSGGGSIAWIDAGGALRVGPQSAGAVPGPACYGISGPEHSEQMLPTVTDANLLLGRLIPEYFLGGNLQLHPEYADLAIRKLGESLGLDPIRTALGIIAVADAHMERALRLVSVERGHDPQQFTLLSFGGAGGNHACSLARKLGIPQVLIPPYASTLSALGMLAASVEKDYTLTVMLPGTASKEVIESAFQALLDNASEDLLKEGINHPDQVFTRSMEMRYSGQSYELPIAWPPTQAGILADFHTAYRQAYSYAHPKAPVEIVNLRVHAAGKREPLALPTFPTRSPDPRAAWLGEREVILEGANRQPESRWLPCYRGESLQPGNLLKGPALIVRSDTTILLHPGDMAEIDNALNLWVEIKPGSY